MLPQTAYRSERCIRAPIWPQCTLSPRSVPTINFEITSGHEAARVADAEYCRTSVLLRHTQLAQHVLRWPVAPALRVLLEQRFHHCRRDVTGRNGVDTNTIGAPLGSKVAAKLEDGGFGGVVRRTYQALEKLLAGSRER
jgi:hypothetical protein